MRFPLDKCNGIPVNLHPGAFGYKRSYYTHPGVDLYCEPDSIVYAMESGVVTSAGDFTGAALKTTWWKDTKYVMITGESGTICYGELTPTVQVGWKIKEGDVIGIIVPVITKEQIRPEIPGHFNHMLHIELYEGKVEEPSDWLFPDSRPKSLLDITPLLISAFGKDSKILSM